MRVVTQPLDTGGRVVGILDSAGRCVAVREEDDNGRAFSWAMPERALDGLRAMVERIGHAERD